MKAWDVWPYLLYWFGTRGACWVIAGCRDDWWVIVGCRGAWWVLAGYIGVWWVQRYMVGVWWVVYRCNGYKIYTGKNTLEYQLVFWWSCSYICVKCMDWLCRYKKCDEEKCIFIIQNVILILLVVWLESSSAIILNLCMEVFNIFYEIN